VRQLLDRYRNALVCRAEVRRGALVSAHQLDRLGVEPHLVNGCGESVFAKSSPDNAVNYHQSVVDLATHTGDRYEQARAQDELARAFRLVRNEARRV
jgi:hypothetical protein